LNYTTYSVLWKLGQQEAKDRAVKGKLAARKLARWVRLHPHNISQKVAIAIEHFRNHVAHLLNGQAKAMLVTSSRKEAVRYKLAFDAYIAEKGYQGIQAMVAFSGKVEDPDLRAEPFTEHNMNPGLKGRDMRKAFDTDEYQVMLAANKFQTGFDQPKLCAMYVDKKLAGVDCVQTLSRLNRTYPGKRTFILDFVNEPQEILDAFRPYYRTAELTDVSDPNLVHELESKLRAAGIFEWHEVEQLVVAYLDPQARPEQLTAACKPGRERFRHRWEYESRLIEQCQEDLLRPEIQQNAAQKAEVEAILKAAREALATLEAFKRDMGSFIRFYEFISQIVDFDDVELEKLCIYSRHLLPLLREEILSDPVDLSGVQMTHYRADVKQHSRLVLEHAEGKGIEPVTDLGRGKGRDDPEIWLSEVIEKLNQIFGGENLTDQDMINYLNTIADKVRENEHVMEQLASNTPEQALLGDLPKAMQDAVLESREAHEKQAMAILGNQVTARNFLGLLLDVLLRKELGKAG